MRELVDLVRVNHHDHVIPQPRAEDLRRARGDAHLVAVFAHTPGGAELPLGLRIAVQGELQLHGVLLEPGQLLCVQRPAV